MSRIYTNEPNLNKRAELSYRGVELGSFTTRAENRSPITKPVEPSRILNQMILELLVLFAVQVGAVQGVCVRYTSNTDKTNPHSIQYSRRSPSNGINLCFGFTLQMKVHSCVHIYLFGTYQSVMQLSFFLLIKLLCNSSQQIFILLAYPRGFFFCAVQYKWLK